MLSSLGTDLIEVLDSANSKVSLINTNHPVFSDVFEKSGSIPTIPIYLLSGAISGYQAISKGTSQTLLGLNNGDPLLIAQSKGEGKVYLSAVPANDKAGNWPRHALFVPAMLNITFMSENVMPMMYYTGKQSSMTSEISNQPRTIFSGLQKLTVLPVLFLNSGEWKARA